MSDFNWNKYQKIDDSDESGFDWDKHPKVDASAPEEPISPLESGIRGGVQGATLGYSDELIGANPLGSGSALGAIKKLLGKDATDEDVKKYELRRDIAREANAKAQSANPKTYLAGELTGGVASTTLLPELRGLSLAKQALGGAALGSTISYGNSEQTDPLTMQNALGAATGLAGGVAGKALEGTSALLPDVKKLYQAGRQGKNLLGEEGQQAISSNMNQLADTYKNAMNTLTSKTGQAVGQAEENVGQLPAQGFLSEQLNKLNDLENSGVVLKNYPKLDQIKNILESGLNKEELPVKNIANMKNQILDLESSLKMENPKTFRDLDIARSFKNYISEASPELSSANQNFSQVKNLEELMDMGSKNLAASSLPYNKQAGEIVDRNKILNFLQTLDKDSQTGQQVRNILKSNISGEEMGIEPQISKLQGLLGKNPETQQSMQDLQSFIPNAKEASEDYRLSQQLNTPIGGSLHKKIETALNKVPYAAGKVAGSNSIINKSFETATNPETYRKLGSVVAPDLANQPKPQDLGRYLTTASNDDLMHIADSMQQDYPDHAAKLKAALQSNDQQGKNAMIFLIQQNKNLRDKALESF